MRRQEESSALGSTPQAWEPGWVCALWSWSLSLFQPFHLPRSSPRMAEPVYKPWWPWPQLDSEQLRRLQRSRLLPSTPRRRDLTL